MRVLITGATGFVGGHLAERLLGEGGLTLAGLSRHAHWPLDLQHLTHQVPLYPLDLVDSAGIEQLLASYQPECIFHLAGYAHTGKSFHEAEKCWENNLTATRRLYDAILKTKLTPRVVFISTGLIYGEPDSGEPACDERTTLKPASPYAASKAAADLLSYQYFRTSGLNVVRVRLFNQIGPRQSPDYAVANFARQIAAAEAGQQPPLLTVGDLSAQRDITDVRDMVAALSALARDGQPGEAYNAGRGQTYRMQELLDHLLALARVSVQVHSQVDPSRKSETSVTRADPSKLRAATGWSPRIPIEQTLADTLDYWRKVIMRG